MNDKSDRQDGDAARSREIAAAMTKAARNHAISISADDLGILARAVPTHDGAEGAVVRDTNMFARLADEPPAIIPEGYSAPLDIRTAAEIEHDRLAAKAAPPKPAPDAMREALQPFAQLFEKFEKGKKDREDNWPSDHVEFNARPRTDKENVGYTFGDLRRAHEALSAPVPPADGAGQWPRVFNVKRAENTWHADISFARYPTDAELQALEISLRGVHPTSNRETFYTILRKYYAQDADFDNLWQELNEAGLVS